VDEPVNGMNGRTLRPDHSALARGSPGDGQRLTNQKVSTRPVLGRTSLLHMGLAGGEYKEKYIARAA
jgi:hypothetical protein